MTDFGEPVVPGFHYRYDGTLLAREDSPFQRIEIWQTEPFGRVLVLDGLLQTTEQDEFCYHEMLVHVPLLMHPNPERVLIIGGGDGGTLRHVLQHPSVRRAVMCEIDERVTRLCLEHMPSVAGGAIDDPRAAVLFDDGIAYVRGDGDSFDAIIVDSSDPVGPGEALFTESFYAAAAQRLAPGGVLAAQTGSPLFQQDELNRAARNMSAAFDDVRTYLGHVPTYPGTLWSFTAAGALSVNGAVAAERARERGLTPRYWSPEVHAAAFGLPRIVADVIAAGDPPRTWGASPEEQRRAVPRG